MNKLALAMIIKGTGDEPSKLERVLSSVHSYVDAIYITLTGPKEELESVKAVCSKYQVTISYLQPIIEVTQDTINWVQSNLHYTPHIQVNDKIFNFAEARNFNFAQIPAEYEWILWLDCDDVFRKGENLQEIIQGAEKQNATAVYVEYYYHVEVNERQEITQVILHHSRERIVRNKAYYWKGIIHEVLTEDQGTFKVFTPDCDVVHLSSDIVRHQSLERNIKNLEAAIYITEGKDNRYIYYLAKAFYDLRQDKYDIISKELIFKFLLGENQSTWEEERAQAWDYLSELYRRHGQFGEAINALMNGLIDDPTFPSLYISLATTYAMKGEWERALFWLNLTQVIPQKPTILAKNPRDNTVRILEIQYNCYKQLHRTREAAQIADQIHQLIPGHPLFATLRDNTTPLLTLPG